jgi:hypothetical protein
LARSGARPVTCGNTELSQIWRPIRARIPPPDPRVSCSAAAGIHGLRAVRWRQTVALGTCAAVTRRPRTQPHGRQGRAPSNPARDLPARRGQPVAVAAFSAQDGSTKVDNRV